MNIINIHFKNCMNLYTCIGTMLVIIILSVKTYKEIQYEYFKLKLKIQFVI